MLEYFINRSITVYPLCMSLACQSGELVELMMYVLIAIWSLSFLLFSVLVLLRHLLSLIEISKLLGLRQFNLRCLEVSQMHRQGAPRHPVGAGSLDRRAPCACMFCCLFSKVFCTASEFVKMAAGWPIEGTLLYSHHSCHLELLANWKPGIAHQQLNFRSVPTFWPT